MAPLLAYLEGTGEDFHMLVMPDHPTPLAIRTHTADPIPYILFKSEDKKCENRIYSEASAKATGVYQPFGHLLMEALLR